MRRILTDMCVLMIILILLGIGIFAFHDRRYVYLAVMIAFLSSAMVYLAYERKAGSIRRMVVIAVFVAMTVMGRFLFAPLPSFKPVTAMVVIAALYLGPEAGFVTGSMTALVSDFYFGIGPWTPFQMCAWGIAGMVAGIPSISRLLKRRKSLLLLYGAAAGIGYSVIMDIWTVLSIDGTFKWGRYFAVVSSGIPMMGIYVVSNVIFLSVLRHPIGKKLERLNKKHAIF